MRASILNVVSLAVIACVILVPADALAWSNGSAGPNSFGTHDWVLREGVRLSGRDGRWVCLHTALKATDDPDMRNGINYASGTWWHVWDEWGSTYGGAPEAVAVWFRRVEVRRRAGNRCGASRALGIMAHMLTDVAQPMHTDGRLPVEESVHSAFEQAVDDRCDISSCRYRAHQDGFDRGPAFARTLAVARAAHRFYGSLVRTFADNGYSPRVDRITRKQLNRAANAMSDLIRSM